MKQINFLPTFSIPLRLAVFMLLFFKFFGATAESYEHFEFTVDGLNYLMYYSGYGANVVPVYALVDRTEGYTGFADIPSSVSYDYTYKAGNDELGNPIYQTKHLTADVKFLYDTFEGCTGLTGVNIPNTVTVIRMAFKGCTGLTSITIPNSVTELGDYSFFGCTGLTSVTIPNSVTHIGMACFMGCIGLTKIDISNSLNTIGADSFSYCYGLTEVIIPNSVTTIKSHAFDECI